MNLHCGSEAFQSLGSRWLKPVSSHSPMRYDVLEMLDRIPSNSLTNYFGGTEAHLERVLGISKRQRPDASRTSGKVCPVEESWLNEPRSVAPGNVERLWRLVCAQHWFPSLVANNTGELL